MRSFRLLFIARRAIWVLWREVSSGGLSLLLNTLSPRAILVHGSLQLFSGS